MTPTLEVCCGNWQSVCAAASAGASRIELCSALPLGGLTPSMGLFRQVKAAFPNLLVHVLIRPREGGFVYTPEETDIILRDISHFIEAGADGIVCGALLPNGDIDQASLARMVKAAATKNFTFHRAFDYVKSPSDALHSLIELGCTHLLTSGSAASALQGVEHIRAWVEQAGEQLTIIPAAGVNAGNAVEILQKTGAKEIHASCSVRQQADSTGPALGADDDGSLLVTDADAVRSLLDALRSVAR